MSAKTVAKNLLFTKEEDKAFTEMLKEASKIVKLTIQLKKSNDKLKKLLEKL
jgi:hypothetical protein